MVCSLSHLLYLCCCCFHPKRDPALLVWMWFTAHRALTPTVTVANCQSVCQIPLVLIEENFAACDMGAWSAQVLFNLLKAFSSSMNLVCLSSSTTVAWLIRPTTWVWCQLKRIALVQALHSFLCVHWRCFSWETTSEDMSHSVGGQTVDAQRNKSHWLTL